MIITIDGPAGAGKSTASRRLAQRLGFEFLDTGAMFRAVGLAGLRAGIDLNDAAQLEGLLATLHLEMPPGRVLLNGDDITGLIRTADVSKASSIVAVQPVVRRRLALWQQQAGEGRNLVCEGRDQGTVVFPHAICKFFLVADPAERARRRQREMAARGEFVDLDTLLRNIKDAITGMEAATWHPWPPLTMPCCWTQPGSPSTRSWIEWKRRYVIVFRNVAKPHCRRQCSRQGSNSNYELRITNYEHG